VTDEHDRTAWRDREGADREADGPWDHADESERADRWAEPVEQDRWAETADSGEQNAWAGPGDAGESGESDEPDESDGGRRGGRPASRAATERSTAWSSPPDPEDELRSFVESEALPSEERMAAAELEAEREAERDAAERRAHSDEVAGAEGAAAAAARRRRGVNGRSVDGRLARLHLKGGLVALARAELETMAGQISLDLEALADLAEARWRSGDLLGAGEAAQAHLARGGDELIALVVAVEALSAAGRTIDARRLAGQVLDRTDGDLDSLFTGQPRAQLWSRPAEAAVAVEEPVIEAPAPTPEAAARAEPASPIWPDESRVTPLETIPPEELPAARVPVETRTVWPEEDRALEAAATEEGAEAGARPAEAEGLEPIAVGPAPARPAPGVAARRELSAIESALRQGRLEPVTGRLALLLRTEPDLADRVAELSLAAIALAGGADAETANLYIVRGDALRVLGRSEEADLAYEQSRRALAPELAEEDLAAESLAAEIVAAEGIAAEGLSAEGLAESALEAEAPAQEAEESGLPAIGLAEPAEPAGPTFTDEEGVIAGEGEYAGDVPAEDVAIAEAGAYETESVEEGWAPRVGYTPEGEAEASRADQPAAEGLMRTEELSEATAESPAPPEESAPAEESGAESSPVESTAGEPTAGEATPEESTAAEPNAGEAAADESAAAESTSRESTAVESAAGADEGESKSAQDGDQ
jgi:hypothetical protein